MRYGTRWVNAPTPYFMLGERWVLTTIRKRARWADLWTIRPHRQSLLSGWRGDRHTCHLLRRSSPGLCQPATTHLDGIALSEGRAALGRSGGSEESVRRLLVPMQDPHLADLAVADVIDADARCVERHPAGLPVRRHSTTT